MTKNQIEYNKLLELQRSNQANEKLTQIRDREAARHNYVSEEVSRLSLDETKRANLIREAETERSNKARENETYRSNVAREDLQRMANEESRRANLAREFETSRHNLASEEVSRGQLQELARSNRAKEQLQSQAQAEVARHNKSGEAISRANVDLGYSQLRETTRANQARELEANRANVAKETEVNRHNMATETETARSNSVREKIDIGRAATYAADVAGRIIYYNKDRDVKVNNIVGSNSSNSPNLGSTGSKKPNGPNNNTPRSDTYEEGQIGAASRSQRFTHTEAWNRYVSQRQGANK